MTLGGVLSLSGPLCVCEIEPWPGCFLRLGLKAGRERAVPGCSHRGQGGWPGAGACSSASPHTAVLGRKRCGLHRGTPRPRRCGGRGLRAEVAAWLPALHPRPPLLGSVLPLLRLLLGSQEQPPWRSGPLRGCPPAGPSARPAFPRLPQGWSCGDNAGVPESPACPAGAPRLGNLRGGRADSEVPDPDSQGRWGRRGLTPGDRHSRGVVKGE